MSCWNTTMLGVKVNSADETLAKQFLVCLGVDFDGYMEEHVGAINGYFDSSIDGTIECDEYGIAGIIENYSAEYISKEEFEYYGEDYYGEDWEDDDEEDDEDNGEDDDEDDVISGLFYLMNQLFPPTYLYIAQESGNDTSDSYYRYESIYDPVAGKKTVSQCYYCYGEGINVDGWERTASATETKEESIFPTALSNDVIELLIKEAESHQFDKLAEKIKACK